MPASSDSRRPPLPPRSVILIGMMGVGKTTVGRRLAQRLMLPFVDADHEIERAAGCSITEIFERYGESSFRDGERRVIARLMTGGRKVIATGGGAFMNAETRTRILRDGIAVWLDADIDTLVARVARRDHRPLLRGADPAELLGRLAAERNPFYRLAPIHIRSGHAPHDAAVDAILAALRGRGGRKPAARPASAAQTPPTTDPRPGERSPKPPTPPEHKGR